MRLLLVLALGCTVDRDVLSNALVACPADVVSAAGEPCAFTGGCAIANDACAPSAQCIDGHLELLPMPPACGRCADDTTCPYGAAICDGSGSCEPCPSLDVCPARDCAPGSEHLLRNGCPVCGCAPSPTCEPGMPCPPNEMCYPGADCAGGCAASDPTCCSAQCAAPGCPEPVPTGCAIACGGLTCPGPCVAVKCACAGSAWSCEPGCATDGQIPMCAM